MMNNRSSGVLCHVSSLPSPYGIGDFGPQAYRFVDFLTRAGQKWWQVLPLNPTDNAVGNSPYNSFSAFGFNILFISPEQLVEDGFLSRKDIERFLVPCSGKVDYDQIYAKKSELVAEAFSQYRQRKFPLKDFEDFCCHQQGWLDDFALFVVLKRQFAGVCWAEWPQEYRDRRPSALESFRQDHASDIQHEKFAQYLFYRQWRDLQAYCSAKGIGLIGDIPIYVNYDSVDVWVHPEFFKLDSQKRPFVVAGVPPDYFSKDGQRWGNPLYDWDKLRASGFSWWSERLRHNLAFFDAVRIDHFRAFAQCWEIPAEEETAVRGAWRDVPGVELFTVLRENFEKLPIIAEDLGIITPDVDALKEKFGFPGMRVLMFAFHNDYKKSRDFPVNYSSNSVVYTGTHDNNTTRGWCENDMTDVEQKNFLEYFGAEPDVENIHWIMIELAMGSAAGMCIIPLQDLLGLGGEARMNCPSTVKGNWLWRFEANSIGRGVSARLRQLTAAALR